MSKKSRRPQSEQDNKTPSPPTPRRALRWRRVGFAAAAIILVGSVAMVTKSVVASMRPPDRRIAAGNPGAWGVLEYTRIGDMLAYYAACCPPDNQPQVVTLRRRPTS